MKIPLIFKKKILQFNKKIFIYFKNIIKFCFDLKFWVKNIKLTFFSMIYTIDSLDKHVTVLFLL